MNQDVVTQLAKEAGCIPRRHPQYWEDVQVFATPEVLMKFANAIEKKVREDNANLCEQLGMKGYGTIYIAVAIREGDEI